MKVATKTYRALYDTGASTNCIHPDVFKEAKRHNKVLKYVNKMRIRTANGDTEIAPVVTIEMNLSGKTEKANYAVLTKCSSPIILGMPGIRKWRLDYIASQDVFQFADKAENVSALQDAPSAIVVPATTQKIKPKSRSHLVCTVLNASTHKPVAHKEVIANVLGSEILANTDVHGRFMVTFTNPTSFPMEFPRSLHLGQADLSTTVAMIGPVNPESSEKILHLASLAPAPGKREKDPEQNGKSSELPMPERIHEAIKHLPKDTQRLLRQTINNNLQAISQNKFDLGLTDLYTHKITLTDKEPVYHKQFPIPVDHAPIIQEHVEKWLHMGVVEPAQSPYNSPIFCVRKKDGGYRLCLDYRGVNEKSLPENYSIRTPEDCISELGTAGAKHFIALDLSSGFYQMPLDKASRPFTAFTVPKHGQLQWTRAAMGLKGCPGSFARLMDMALKGISGVLIYIDDLLVYGKTQQETIETLDKVLRRLIKHNLKVNLSKSTFLTPTTDYLGFTLSAHGIYPGKSKTQAITQAKPPQTRKQLKAFLGMCNYYRNFVKHFAHKAGRLYALTRQESRWKGGPLPAEALQVFNELKKVIVETVPRSFPFKDGKYHLFTDGSLGDSKEEGGLGGHLMQEDPQGNLHSIGWASRALAKHEKNYSSFLLELQSACWNIEYFSHYLRGKPFILYTDHAPLTKLSTVHSRTLHRLHHLLNEYSFEIRHIEGKKNSVADFLSRSHGPALVSSIEEIASLSEVQNMRTLQDKDPVLGPIIQSILKNESPAWPAEYKRSSQRISLHKGVLCARLEPRPGFPMDDKYRVLAPTTIRKALLHEAHNSALGGHQGIFRTLERIRLSFWWPQMQRDIADHCAQCQDCQATSDKDLPAPLPNQELPQTKFPNERIHADLFGPLTGADGNSCYVLGITDSFTKILRLSVIPNKEAKTTALALWREWFTIYGIPKLVVTDGGAEFCNALQEAIYDVLQVEHKVTTPYWPRCNMAQEHQNKTLAQYMRTILHAAKKSTLDWEVYLPALMFSLNTAVNRALKASPFQVMFGYDPRVPLYSDLNILNEDDYKMPADDKDAFYQWQDTRKAVRQAAHANERHFRDQEFLTQQEQLTSFSAKQEVWAKIQPLTKPNKKFKPRWEPAVIISRLSPTTYKIKRLHSKNKKIVTINAAYLKPRKEGLLLPDEDDEVDLEEDPLVPTQPLGQPTNPQEPSDEMAVVDLSAVTFRDSKGFTFNIDEWLGRKSHHTSAELKHMFSKLLRTNDPNDYSIAFHRNLVTMPAAVQLHPPQAGPMPDQPGPQLPSPPGTPPGSPASSDSFSWPSPPGPASPLPSPPQHSPRSSSSSSAPFPDVSPPQTPAPGQVAPWQPLPPPPSDSPSQARAATPPPVQATPPPVHVPQSTRTEATPPAEEDGQTPFATPAQELGTPEPRRGRRTQRLYPDLETPEATPRTAPGRRSASEARRQLQFSPEGPSQPADPAPSAPPAQDPDWPSPIAHRTPPQQQQQQQPPIHPFMPPEVVFTRQGASQGPQIWTRRVDQLNARTYQATRSRAREQFMNMAMQNIPESVQQQGRLTEWRQHHEAIFAALNPRPQEIYDPTLLNPQEAEPPHQWEGAYRAQIAQLVQQHHPRRVHNPRQAADLYSPRVGQRPERQKRH
jgi:hypothetical protein